MKSQRFKSVVLVVLMLVSVFALAPLMATADHDANNPDTHFTTASEWAGDGTDLVSDFDATDDGTNATIEEVEFQTSANNNSSTEIDTVKLNITHDGVEHYEVSGQPADLENVDVVLGQDTDPIEVHFNVSHDDLDTLPGQPGENTSTNVSIELYDANGDVLEIDAGNPERVDIGVDFEFASRNVMYISEGTSAFGGVDHTEEEPAVWQIFADDVPDTYVIEETRTLKANSSDSTNSLSQDAAVDNVTIHLAHSDMAADFAEEADGAESGDLLVGFAGYDDGEEAIIPVFYDAADEDFVDTNDTYIVYDDSTDEMMLHVGEDTGSIQFSAANHGLTKLDAVGLSELRDEFGNFDAIRLWAGLGTGITLSIALVVGFRRREE